VAVLPLLSHVLVVQSGFECNIAVNIYAFRLAFSSILPCILHQNTLHLAQKYLAFSTKIPCILHQNALHFAPKYTAFSTKMHFI
jgi:hypothetical protein